ncbi:MAG: hypothetical protein M3478_09535 [Planctomycetota bacterium]|nr:hypothetical protein [Planctomycetota bacterium]
MIRSICPARCEPLESRVLFNDVPAPTILFVRGGTRTGGFLEATEPAARDLELADIANASTAARNAGWATLAATLRDQGFSVEQFNEAKGAAGPWDGFYQGKPIRFDTLDLTRFAAIVFGSNNAQYPKYVVDSVERYVRGGGGAMFISDANFGSDWADAANSDQMFLNRFGLTVNQDTGPTTLLSRSAGDFVVADHPVLAGVDGFEGEGMSPFVVPDVPPPDTTITRLVAARGNTRNNNGGGRPETMFAGTIRPTNDRDASVVLVNAGAGRVVGFFDRNTFFNANGRGTDIAKHDNRQLAINLFNWVTDNSPPVVTQGTFTQGGPSQIVLKFNDHLNGSLTRDDIFLRNGVTGAAIPNVRWWMEVEDSIEGTKLTVFTKGAQGVGDYWMQINPFRISDDSGNPNRKRIRFHFTIANPLPSPPMAPIMAAHATERDAPNRLFDELSGSEPIELTDAPKNA